MKKVIIVFVLLSGFLLSNVSSSSVRTINSNSQEVENHRKEWVEYLLVGAQWYKITHLDNGENIIQAVMGAGQD